MAEDRAERVPDQRCKLDDHESPKAADQAREWIASKLAVEGVSGRQWTGS
jgi:hypothetical protein